MYVAVRRYEGVTDPQKVAQLGEEGDQAVPQFPQRSGDVPHRHAGVEQVLHDAGVVGDGLEPGPPRA